MNKLYQLSFRSKIDFLFKSLLLVTAIFAGVSSKVKAQVSAYTFSQSTGTFAPISGTVLGTATGNTSATNLNSAVYPVTLPFGFNFNDAVYTSMNVSSNGFITFGATPPLTSTTAPISVALDYNGAIAAFGRDLVSLFNVAGVTGNISWDVVGTAPNREIVIQWRDFRPTNTTSTTAAYTLSFQIRLQETSNIIKVIYSSGSYLVGTTSYSSTVQVGLRGSTNSDFNNRENATTVEYINSSAGAANNSAQNFNTTNAIPGMPTSGLTYTWTPPTCFSPLGLTFVSSTTTSANISWNAVSSAPSNGYDVYYSTSNTAPTSSTTPQLTGITTNSTTIPSLLSSTVYYVWIRSNCGSGNTGAWSFQPIAVVTQCQPPAVLSTTGAVFCPGSTATLNATTVPGGTLNWYDAPTGGNLVGSGSSFTTPALSATTNYYVSASVGGISSVGKTTLESNASTGGGLSSYMLFTAISDFILNTVDVFPYSATAGTAGTVTIALLTESGTLITSATVNVTGASSVATSVPQTVTLNFPVTGGSSYRLAVSAWTGVTNMYRDATNLAFPYSAPGIVDITGGNLTIPYYYFYYNWKIKTGCESTRTMVAATIDSACLSTSEVDKKKDIKVYPNPFSDVINIDRPDLVKSVQITDLSGKLVRNNIKAESVLRLNDLTAGSYIMLLDMKNGSKQTVKIIKK